MMKEEKNKEKTKEGRRCNNDVVTINNNSNF